MSLKLTHLLKPRQISNLPFVSFPQLTSVEVTEAFIERCKEINPLLNCVVDQCYKAALNDAAKADKLVASGTLTEEQLATEKPFLGVPISTKDCIRVKGKITTAIELRACH